MPERDQQEFLQSIRARLHRTRTGGLEVKNATGPVATIRIYDEIGFFGITAEDFASQLDRVTAPEIEVQISSPGGEVFDGIAIYNALRAHPAKITTRVDSMAASVASVIVQAGDHRIMLSASQMMIHQAHGLAIGNAGVMRDFADILEQQDGVIAGVYAERSGRTADEFMGLMAQETWFTAEEAIEAGLADELVTPKSDDDAKTGSGNNVATVTLTTDQLRALFADSAPKIPDADPAPGVEPPTPGGGPDPDADPALGTDLLQALSGALDKET